MPSINTQLDDRFIRHAVDLARLEAGLQQQAVSILKKLEEELIARLAVSSPTGIARTAFQQRRLTLLLSQVQATIQKWYAELDRATQKELRAFAAVEQDFVVRALNDSFGVDIVTPVLDRVTLRQLAKDTLIQGAPSAEWWSRQSSDLRRRFLDEMRSGVAQGETLAQLMQRVRGTRARSFQDGILRTNRAGAERLVRSSVQTLANRVREDIYAEHSDLIKGVIWHSTLDARTSMQCQVRDRKEYTLDHRPVGHAIPWGGGPGSLHWNCRSSSVPRTRSWAELSRSQAVQSGAGSHPASIRVLYERKLRQAGFSDADIAVRVMDARSSMDGLVPRALTFPQWLRSKENDLPGFGVKVLGPTRWGLWRSGKLSFADLVNFQGEPLRVADLLAQRDT